MCGLDAFRICIRDSVMNCLSSKQKCSVGGLAPKGKHIPQFLVTITESGLSLTRSLLIILK